LKRIPRECWFCGELVEPDAQGRCPKCQVQLPRFDVSLKIVDEEVAKSEPQVNPDPIKQREAELAIQFHQWLKEKRILPKGFLFTTRGALLGQLSRPEFGLKLLVISEKGLDASSLLHRSGFEVSHVDYRSTLGFNMAFRDYEISDNLVRVLAWNVLPPQNPYQMNHYRGAHGALYLYNVLDKSSLLQVQPLSEVVTRISGDIPSSLVGHKPGPSRRRQVTRKQGKALAVQLDIPYYETRDPTGPHLEKALQDLVPRMLGFAKT
jgi:hypothetical protein